MKAVYINEYGGSENMVYGELEMPEIQKNHILIKMAASSVNPVDWKVREGRLKFITGKKFPFILGTELSGVVESTGEKVSDFKKGDRVFAVLGYKGGALAEYVSVSEKQVVKLDDKISFEQASTLAVAGVTPLQAFTMHYKVKPGDEVLVNGASGGVGSYAVQIAKILGARVTAVCSEHNAVFVKKLGADEVIDYKNEDFRKRKLAFNVILDAASNANFQEVKQTLKEGGMLIKLNLSLKTLITRIWTVLFSSRDLKLILLKNRHNDIRWLMDQIVQGRLKVHIEKIYNLPEADQAYELSQRGHVRGKLVILG